MLSKPERRTLIVDAVLAVLFFLAILPLIFNNVLEILVLLVFSGALVIRRLFPGIALAGIWFGAILQMLFRLTPQPGDLALCIVLYATAAYGRRIIRWLGLASAVGGAIIATLYFILIKPLANQATDSIGIFANLILGGLLFTAFVSVLTLAWGAGLLVRAIRENRESRRRAEQATRERSLAEYRYVVEQERNRIARDMHDVVAHSLAVVIAQADGARFASKTKPEVSQKALATIAEVARGALGEVRSLLAELRLSQPDGAQPALQDLDSLFVQLRAAGMDVQFVEQGQRENVGASGELAIYRITQEALTNALRHGDISHPVNVRLSWEDKGANINVTSSLIAGAVAGGPTVSGREGAVAGEQTGVTSETLADPGRLRHGIPGMRERAQLAGGFFQAEVMNNTFQVRAQIPYLTKQSRGRFS